MAPEDASLRDYFPDKFEHDGFFHVTTNLAGVLCMGLLSRRALGGAVGLGGGPDNVAPNSVSLTVTYDAAQRLYRAIHVMLRAVHGEISGEDALAEFEDLDDSIISELDAIEEGMCDGGESTGYFEAFDKYTARIKKAKPGPKLYAAIQDFESFLSETYLDLGERGDEDSTYCAGTVGFTAPAGVFARIQPEQVAILQCAVARQELDRVDDFIPYECELRVQPSTVAVVGWRR